MRLKLDKNNLNKLYKLFDMKETNISLADSLFSLYDRELVSLNSSNVFNIILNELNINPEDEENNSFLKKTIMSNLKKIEDSEILNNPYINNIKIRNVNSAGYKLKYDLIAKNTLFPYDDIDIDNNDYYINKYKIGFLSDSIQVPSLSYKNNVWMSIIPNEIETMKPYIEKAHGKVAVYGLGLGYYAYMISLKDDVTSIDIIEKDNNIINIFKSNLFPLFKNKEKFNIIKDDAFLHMNKGLYYDYNFIDIYRDPTDGLPIYLKCKKLERNTMEYGYWLEKSILDMYRRCMITVLEESLLGYDDKEYSKSSNKMGEIINNIYFKTKEIEFNTYLEIKEFLSDDSLIKLIKKES